MRLAAFNAENLFDRAKALNFDNFEEGQKILEPFSELNKLFGAPKYTESMKSRMVELLVGLGLENSDQGPFVILRRNKGGLLRRPRSGGLEIVANGRTEWVGSLELVEEPIDEIPMRLTARVMIDSESDILGVVEVESRPVLAAFSKQVITALQGKPFAQVMVIDGNDNRGIDVGVMVRSGFTIESMKSHVDDLDPNGEYVFSRDCPEYTIRTPSGARLIVLVNHFKSKSGDQRRANAKRKSQADRVKKIYDALVAEGERHVAIVGDLNDAPDSVPLGALLNETDLKDISKHDKFDDGGHPGTYKLC